MQAMKKVLSYHSLEDRRVKRILNKGNLQGIEVKVQ